MSIVLLRLTLFVLFVFLAIVTGFVAFASLLTDWTLAMAWLAVSILLLIVSAGALLLPLKMFPGSYDTSDTDIKDHQKLIVLIEEMSYSLPRDRVDSMISLIQDAAEDELALDCFLSNLHDFEVPIPRSIIERLCALSYGKYDEVKKHLPLLADQIIDEEQALPIDKQEDEHVP